MHYIILMVLTLLACDSTKVNASGEVKIECETVVSNMGVWHKCNTPEGDICWLFDDKLSCVNGH